MKRINEKNHFHNFFKNRSWTENHRHNLNTGSLWRQLKTNIATATAIIVSFLLFLFVFIQAGWINSSLFSGIFSHKSISTITPAGNVSHKSISTITPISTKIPKILEFPLKCVKPNVKQTCSRTYPKMHNPMVHSSHSSGLTCPSYFKWIHEDLRPWKDTGITKGMVDRARKTAHFRLVILDGKAYVEKYRQSIQTRDMFTLWGILQLLRVYPGKLPDLELMFDCDDRPVIQSRDFRGPNASPPPLFRYCADEFSLDIVFPDWSFWGWAEINIEPWRYVLKNIKEANQRTKWKDREAFAYWKGNPYVAPIRRDLLKCNVSKQNDWNTRLYIQDWVKESKQGYKESKLEDQCKHRYKIYIEGWAWSVSEKYILACDSMTLYVKPHYYDFFMRGMEPLKHYWPIRENNKCTSLKFAVEWGNNHTDKAQTIGETTSKFVQEDLKMEYVYDYMFHLLNEYAKLLKFKPTKPKAAVELCSETMACPANGTWKKFMVESLVKSPSHTTPCTLPPPFEPQLLHQFLDKKAKSIRQVELWENQYWHNNNNKH